MNENVQDRLFRFDDLMTEIMVGLALALLIAIGFAPQIVGMPSHRWEVLLQHTENSKQTHIITVSLDDWLDNTAHKETQTNSTNNILSCPICNSSLEANNYELFCSHCDWHTVPQKSDNGTLLRTAAGLSVGAAEPVPQKSKGEAENGKGPAVSVREFLQRKMVTEIKCPVCDNNKDNWTIVEDLTEEGIEPGHNGLRCVDNGVPGWLEEARRWRPLTLSSDDRIVDRHFVLTGFLWLFLCLFCIKLIHEQSVLRYHFARLNEENIKLTQGDGANFFSFVSRFLLLVFLYGIVINVFLTNNGDVRNITGTLIAMLLMVSYALPDLIFYRSLLSAKGRKDSEICKWLIRDVVWNWLNIDCLNIVVSINLFLNHYIPIVGSFLSVIVAIILAVAFVVRHGQGLSSQEALNRAEGDPFAIEEPILPSGWFARLKQSRAILWQRWVRETLHAWTPYATHERKNMSFIVYWILLALVFLLASSTASQILSSSSSDHVAKHFFVNLNEWIVVLILGVNLLDWLTNRRFFFGEWEYANILPTPPTPTPPTPTPPTPTPPTPTPPTPTPPTPTPPTPTPPTPTPPTPTPPTPTPPTPTPPTPTPPTPTPPTPTPPTPTPPTPTP